MAAAFLSISNAYATFSGWGVVNMEGAIIDGACSISSESRDQTINMGYTPIGEVVREGRGTEKPFSLQLIHCDISRSNSKLSDWKHFKLTFDGKADGKFFGLNGGAKGVALEIKDEQGNIAVPGEAMASHGIIPGSMRLDYTIRLVSNNKLLTSGTYTSSVRFKMDYY